MEVIVFSEVIDAAITRVSAQTGHDVLPVVVDVEPSLVAIPGEREPLTDVMVALLMRALDVTTDRHVVVEVRQLLSKGTSEGDWLWVSVKHGARTMSTEAVAAQPIVASCRDIVAEHHGRMWAASTADGGHTVVFMLPLRASG